MLTSKTCRRRRLLSRLNREDAARVIRWGLAGIFIYSGMVKLFDPLRFAEIIAGFGLLPAQWIQPVAIGLPLAELIAGLGLLFSVPGSLTTIALMLVLFMVVLAHGIHLGLDIDCGCFGPEDPEQAYKGLKVALMRDAVMLAAVFFVCWDQRKAKQPNTSPTNQPTKEHP